VTRERRALGKKRTRQSKRFEYTANKRLIIRDSFLYDRSCTVASLLEFDTCDSLDISQYWESVALQYFYAYRNIEYVTLVCKFSSISSLALFSLGSLSYTAFSFTPILSFLRRVSCTVVASCYKPLGTYATTQVIGRGGEGYKLRS